MQHDVLAKIPGVSEALRLVCGRMDIESVATDVLITERRTKLL